ncbi:SDR family oxidoreductase [Pseudomonas sp. 5P_3.1_Bac2]|uniref:SDR family oxidoreductase n=1 Tax=Pseudomonas sp. 5P_3.1_Bac2 TaxID=2971617 RepID=UPI0021C87929|nr:SDR family oxidoreductase [Pseudomonas sp. 5P_3.1_Bac2]MCU1717576.1 SDR family oxidoreductase [Pseudomonas sp. 5P_3.1_Bac2]
MLTTVVSGSASGIGAAVVQALRAAGQRVIGIDLRDAEVIADLSSAEGRRLALQAVQAQLDGRLEGLVLCAGLGPQVRPESLIVSINYFAALELLDGLLPLLQKGDSSAAVVISSTAATSLEWADNPLAGALVAGDEAAAGERVMAAGAQGGYLAYAASKNALSVAVRQRVATWGQAGVRLNSVAPGATRTPLLAAGLQDPRYGQAIRDYISPLGRNAEPHEIAEAVLFLLGPRASFIHGAQLFVDGGIDALTRPTRL